MRTLIAVEKQAGRLLTRVVSAAELPFLPQLGEMKEFLEAEANGSEHKLFTTTYFWTSEPILTLTVVLPDDDLGSRIMKVNQFEARVLVTSGLQPGRAYVARERLADFLRVAQPGDTFESGPFVFIIPAGFTRPSARRNTHLLAYAESAA